MTHCTAAVVSYVPNGFGLFDMHGNLWEWCEDGYLADSYARLEPRKGDGPRDSAETGKKAIRGGSYFAPFQDSRSAERTGIPPDTRARGVGVRPARYPAQTSGILGRSRR